ncbi:TPA: hypothetical protein DDZ86_03805 [Candidatus Dependentiae bacterium]|nr:hypothetical protein [Candidatus Dependentiae bacterium]
MTVHAFEDDNTEYVSFAHRVFSRHDCKKYLDRNVIARGYQPVHITVSNHSNRYLYFSTSHFSFPCADVECVAHSVHTSTAGRAVGYGVAGLFIWPFLIPAIVDGVGSAEANQALDADFERKSVEDQEMRPFSVLNGLFFVPVEYFTPKFSLFLVDVKTREKFKLDTCRPALKI